MKKILYAIAIVLTIGLTANAQGRDGFFSNYDNGYSDRIADPSTVDFNLPGNPALGNGENESAPLGSGLLVLTALGAGYAFYRKKRS